MNEQNVTLNKYATILYTRDGKALRLINDGGSEPMSTGTDEWSEYFPNDPGKLMNKETAVQRAVNPNCGYGSPPRPSKRVVYQVMLVPVEVHED